MARLIKSLETINEVSSARALDVKEEIGRTLLQVAHIAASERDADFVQLSGGHGGTGRIVFFFTLSDVTHLVGDRGD